jgi:hypothetical protein
MTIILAFPDAEIAAFPYGLEIFESSSAFFLFYKLTKVPGSERIGLNIPVGIRRFKIGSFQTAKTLRCAEGFHFNIQFSDVDRRV